MIKKMKQNKNGYWKLVKNGFIRIEEQMDILITKAPKSYILFWNLTIFGVLVIIGGVMFLEYQKTKAIPFEVEGSCNTGFIGVDYQMDFKNEPYKSEWYSGNGSLVNRTAVHTTNYPRHLNIKNIDGLNCNFKLKGAVPYNKMQEIGW